LQALLAYSAFAVWFRYHEDGPKKPLRRYEGRDEVRRQYETEFALMPDCRCDLRLFTGNSGRAVAESLFRGTRPRSGRVIEAIGAEVIEIVDGKIKEIRDYHRSLPAKAA